MSKEQERTELHRTIWQIANDLRGSVDGWDFKQYVLGMLFYRFISENLTNYINANEPEQDFDYAKLSDSDAEFGRADTVKEKGFYILPNELFVTVAKNAANDSNLNETLATIFRDIESSAKGTESEDDLKGLFDDLDVNSNKLGSTVEKRNKQLVKLLTAIACLKLGSSNNTIDAFGDAYEYLMQMYASNAGKSGGEYYTPQEVSELLAEISTVGKTEVNKVYDPACGSGSLLLKFAKVLGKENVRIGFYGQEVNLTTYNLCRINMFLHDINYNHFDIAHGDTLTDPNHWDDEPFDAIVSNPPYSIKWEGKNNPLLINDPRFSPAGVLAPPSKADLAFTMHMLSWLSTSGTAAIVEFPGVLYRGGAEQKIRKYLIENNYIDTVIQLPPDLFFGTTIATCIIVLKKSKKDNKTLFIDASAEFVRGGNKNKLSDENRQNILTAFKNREDSEYFATLVDNQKIGENDYNIAVSSYVEQEDTREVIDITQLNAEISQIVARQSELRTATDEIVADIEGGVTNKIDQLIEELCPQGVEFRALGEVGNFFRGKRFVKTDIMTEGVPCIHYGEMYTHYNIWAEKSKSFLKPELAKKLRVAQPGDVVIVAAGETIEDIGKGVAWLGNSDVVVHDACFIFRHNLNPKYISFFLQTNQFHSQIKRHISSGKISSINAKGLGKAKIPIPPLTIQKEIVKILDNFTRLEAELKAEMEARKKQYGHYREELLSLKPLETQDAN